MPVIVRYHIRNLQQVETAVKEADGGTVVHTFVHSSLREAIHRPAWLPPESHQTVPRVSPENTVPVILPFQP